MNFFISDYSNENVTNSTDVESHLEEQTRVVNIDFSDSLGQKDINSIPNIEPVIIKSIIDESPSTSDESSSRTSDERFSSEECHVVPHFINLKDELILEANEDLSKSSNHSLDLKSRHASIDSVMDSALGDSCSSTECQNRKTEDECDLEKTNYKDWHDNGESLALRLPGKYIINSPADRIKIELFSFIFHFTCQFSQDHCSKNIFFFLDNSYYQVKPRRYIFPGAEVYGDSPWIEQEQQFCEEKSKSKEIDTH